MTFDFCNIRQTTNREAEELPIQSTSDTLANTCLADTRWAN
jgi:hypothetical protein